MCAQKIQDKWTRNRLIDELEDVLPKKDKELQARDLNEINRLVTELTPLYRELYAKKPLFTAPKDYDTYQDIQDKTNLYLIKIQLEWARLFLDAFEKASAPFLTAYEQAKELSGKLNEDKPDKQKQQLSKEYEALEKTWTGIVDTHDTKPQGSLSYLMLHQKQYIRSTQTKYYKHAPSLKPTSPTWREWNKDGFPPSQQTIYIKGVLHFVFELIIKATQDKIKAQEKLFDDIYKRRIQEHKQDKPCSDIRSDIRVDDEIFHYFGQDNLDMVYGPYACVRKQLEESKQGDTAQLAK